MLLPAGFADDDMLVERTMSVLQQVPREEGSEQTESLLVRLFHAVEDAGTGVGPSLRYVGEAQAGRWLVGASDAQSNRLIRVRNVLINHDARTTRAFEPGGVRSLA